MRKLWKFLAAATVFTILVAVPDPVPFIDEIFTAGLTIKYLYDLLIGGKK